MSSGVPNTVVVLINDSVRSRCWYGSDGDTGDGHAVVIAFPDLEAARAWYDSAAYQEIKPLRTRHRPGAVILIEGVSPGHSAAKLAGALRAYR